MVNNLPLKGTLNDGCNMFINKFFFFKIKHRQQRILREHFFNGIIHHHTGPLPGPMVTIQTCQTSHFFQYKFFFGHFYDGRNIYPLQQHPLCHIHDATECPNNLNVAIYLNTLRICTEKASTRRNLQSAEVVLFVFHLRLLSWINSTSMLLLVRELLWVTVINTYMFLNKSWTPRDTLNGCLWRKAPPKVSERI